MAMKQHPAAGRLAALLCAGWTATWPASPAAAQPRASTPRTDDITVVSLNLWHDAHDWPARLARIVAGLRALDPDVICLQEVLQNPVLPNQAATIADSLGCAYRFVSVDGEERPKRYGNAILTRHPLLADGGKFLLPLNDWRVVAHVRVDVRGRALDVYDTHLHHTPEGGAIRAEQIRDLLAYVDSTRGDGPAVLAGDFNCELGSPEMRPLERDWLDAFAATHPRVRGEQAATMNPRFDGGAARAIDHVFVPRRGRLVPREAEILFRDCGPDSVWASDHYGVLARLGSPDSR